MRTFFTIAIAFLFAILVAGASWVHAIDGDCHENGQAAEMMGGMVATDCCCSPAAGKICGYSASHIRLTAAYCPAAACGCSPITKEFAHLVSIPPLEHSGVTEIPEFSQAVLRTWPRKLHADPRPPPSSFPHRYIQHCSFLI